MDEKDAAQRFVKGTFNCQMQLSQNRMLTITGHVYDTDSKEDTNARIDEAMDSLDRQFIRCDIVNKEAQIANLLENVKLIRDDMETLAARDAGTGLSAERPQKARLTSVEKERLQKGDQVAKQNLATVDALQAAIRAARAKLGTPAA